MTDYYLRNKFAEVIGESRVDMAAADADLVAFYELRMKGRTAAVPADRAELIEDYDAQQLHGELQRDYYLTDAEVPQAVARCVGQIANVQVGFKK